jgi:hypothetical protein
LKSLHGRDGDGVHAAVMGICGTFESGLPDADPPCDEI